MFLTLGAHKKVRGLYLVGPEPSAQQIDGTTAATMRLLAQALGRPISIRFPVGTATTTRWTEGATPTVPRWRGGRLVELRVGDVKP